MRKLLIVCCIIAQVAVLAYMIGGRELILKNGQRIYVKTAPVDPRDIFRGDFVRLEYEFNTVSSRDIQGAVNTSQLNRGAPVYAILAQRTGGLYSFSRLSDSVPDDGVFIKGRVDNVLRGAPNELVRIKYGIEQLFVEQGKGKEIERRRGQQGQLQVPMVVEIAVSNSGTAVLRDFSWSRLGMQMEVLRTNSSNRGVDAEAIAGTEPLSPLIRITLENVSDAPLRLDNPGNNCGFVLVPVVRSSVDSAAKRPECDNVTGQTIPLNPGQQYSVDIDLSDPRWEMQFISATGIRTSGEIGRIRPNDMFRLLYRSASPASDLSVTAASDSWIGELASQAFNARGRTD